MFETIAKFRERRPESLQEWDLDDISNFRSLEFDLSERAARDYVDRYVASPLPKGWRFLR